MADTPETRAAEALKLADVLDDNPDTSGAHGDYAAELLRALATDVTSLSDISEALRDEMKKIALATGRSETDGEEDCDWAFLGEEVAEIVAERDDLRQQLQSDVPRPRLCLTCAHAVGHPDNCARNHGKPGAHKTCSDWAPTTEAEHG